MRRSCAPSMLRAREVEKRRKIDELFEDTENQTQETEVSSSTWNTENHWGTSKLKAGSSAGIQNNKENNDYFSTKVIFNVVWREITKKKHKTWDGDGLLEVQTTDTPRAILKDSMGKYIGSNTKFKLDELEEGHQMIVGGKEIELLEQITDRNEYFTLRRKQAESRWDTEQDEAHSSRANEKLRITTLFQAPYQIKNIDEHSSRATSTRSSGIGRQQNEFEGMTGPVTEHLVYNVVWREVSTKKNKTWNGDGTFEVSTRDQNKGILKDENGLEMGELENVNREELKVGALMLLGDKEFEILEETGTDKAEVTINALQTLPNRKEAISGKQLNAHSFILPPPPAALNVSARPIQPVVVSHRIAQHLRSHQRDGVCFIYKCVMGFHDTPTQRGCILADEMGLGKPLQCIALAHTLLKTGPYGGERVLQRVLIVTPSTLTRNWEQEVNKWLKNERMYAFVVGGGGAGAGGGKQKLNAYAKQQHVPFVVVSYEILLGHLEEFQRLKFDMLICDEGHRLKNPATKIVIALRELNIPRRVLITGTPVQNDLREFYALADFVNPGIFGTAKQFHAYFEVPLQQSQSPDASEEVKCLAAQRSEELAAITDRFVLRRLQHVNGQYLPRKYEYICFVQPSELQYFLLQKALHLYAQRRDTLLRDLTPLQIITVLKKICNHPSLIARTQTPNLLTRNLEAALPDWSEMGPFDSAKLDLVQSFLVAIKAQQQREKCVLVSSHTKTLNMLQGLCDFLNIKCLRLDGSTSVAERNANVTRFNNPADDTLVFLLSAKAGGVGLNLIGASRLILFDQDWNPATDAQAMSRIWRDGQQNDVHIYRLVTAGCIEEKIFQRQIAKISLGDCVTQGIIACGSSKDDTMKFSPEELLDLFSLQEDYSVCQTHESLNCKCAGDGETSFSSYDHQNAKQINELMNWCHYKPPFDADLLQSAGLHKASDSLLYIFANQTDYS